MKRFLLSCLILIAAFSLQPVKAQIYDWDTRFGIQGSFIFPENEFANLGFFGNNNLTFDWYKFSFLGETYIGIGFSKVVELQLTLGYGNYAGKAYFDSPTESLGEYNTTIIPASLRLKIRPWKNEKWNPYFYFGGGALYYSIVNFPEQNPNLESVDESQSTAGLLPFGFGLEYPLSELIFLDLSIGYAFIANNEIDGYLSENDEFWDSYLNIGAGITFMYESCNSDKDGDGLGRCEEQKIGTDPKNPDTDGDGLSDGQEVIKYFTNPLNEDSDADSLSDGDEVLKYATNPLNKDTDGDNLSDSDEILTYRTDPTKLDTDGDQLSDGDEVMKCKTDPLIADTDTDSLTDGDEILSYRTDPLKSDSDGEGLSDSDELFTYSTNPMNRDTDDGTVDDFTEVKRGSDPLNPEDDVVKINVPIVLEGITFASGKWDITPESEVTLESVLVTLQTNPEIIVEINGYTDDVGSNAFNLDLSQRRASSVRYWLLNRGIEPDRIIAKGFGEEYPRVPNDSAENRRMNRRIEFKRIQ